MNRQECYRTEDESPRMQITFMNYCSFASTLPLEVLFASLLEKLSNVYNCISVAWCVCVNEEAADVAQVHAGLDPRNCL